MFVLLKWKLKIFVGRPDGWIGKTVVSRLATYLCRMGSSHASGMLVKYRVVKNVNIKPLDMYELQWFQSIIRLHYRELPWLSSTSGQSIKTRI